MGAILDLPCPFVILSFRNLSNENFSSQFSQDLWGLEDWNLVHTWTVGRCIRCTGIGLLLLILPFISSFFFLSNFQTLKFFVTLFSGPVRPRRLKLGIHVERWLDILCIPESGCCCLFLPLFIFLSLQFSNIKIFCDTFLRNCEAYKVETWYTRGQWADVSCIPESGCCSYLSLYFFIMPPTLKKLMGHIGFGLSVRASVRQEPCMLGFWNFIYGFLMEK